MGNFFERIRRPPTTTPPAGQDDHIQKLIQAFNKDDFDVDPTPNKGIFPYNNKIGILAEHRHAVCRGTGKKKKAYYVEGSGFEMGYLLGLMAEPEMEKMCTTFNRNVVFEFIGLDLDPEIQKILGDILEDILNFFSKGIRKDLPKEYQDELDGILKACKKANPNTQVDEKSLTVLNVGIDTLLTIVFTGKLPKDKIIPFPLKPELFRIPLACNGFSISGPYIKNNGHLFGRDFMFPTGGVYQDVACHIVHNPDNGNPFISMTAPGMIGCVAGINNYSVSVGVDVSPAGNCNPDRVGMNSMLLTRYSIQHGSTCEEAVDKMVEAQRGVSWIYILADGVTDKACIVEAGYKTDSLDFLSYPPKFLKSILPDQNFLEKHPSTEFRKGLMVRWQDYQYPEAYLMYNSGLFLEYKKRHLGYTYRFNPGDFLERGYLEKSWKGRNCPKGYYFVPQREKDPNLVLTTNTVIIPEMRLCAMNEWTNIVTGAYWNDVQWRYDELNHELLEAIDNSKKTSKPIPYDKIKQIIDFLNPNGPFREYYDNDKYNPEHLPPDDIQVEGSTSLMDLKAKTIESHYGYYGDKWVKMHMDYYLDG